MMFVRLFLSCTYVLAEILQDLHIDIETEVCRDDRERFALHLPSVFSLKIGGESSKDIPMVTSQILGAAMASLDFVQKPC